MSDEKQRTTTIGRLVLTSCRHCSRRLARCVVCDCRYDTGRLCQACSFGLACVVCGRHWTNP